MSTVSLENLKISAEKEGKNSAVFSFEPLPTGFGYTLGNALRRVLLTSIPGSAATQVKIGGANHQFTTVSGVKEDMVELTLNLKKLRFKLHSNSPVIITLKKKGAGDVKASDFDLPSDVELMNKDEHIATLSDSKAELTLEVTVEPGTGYSPMEDRQTSKIGVIVLDALFSPVVRTNFSVEPTRFGDKTDLDKVLISLETDGSVTPREAVKTAASILKGYYETISKWDLKAAGTQMVIEAEEEEKTVDMTSKEDVAIEELPLQTRTINALKKHGIETLKQLGSKTDEEISDIKNLGEKSLEEIKNLLVKEGFR